MTDRDKMMKLAMEMRDRLCTRLLKKQASWDCNNGVNVPAISTLRTFRQQNYTVVLLNEDIVGVSKRMAKDPQNSTTGLNKALYRAVRRLVTASQR